MIKLKPHNQTAVNEIKEKIKTGYKKIIYVSGTGCGKSYVFMGSIYMLKEEIPEMQQNRTFKVLYILPKHVIKENLEGYQDYQNLECTVEFCTFNYFTSIEKGKRKFQEYDYIVIDECHHLGADRYGKNIVKCMQESDKYILGLTATPVRDMDKLDVTDYFETRVNGLSVWDAIRQGLMPSFNYHICLPEKDTRQVEREYDNEIRAVVDYMDSAEAVNDIVSLYERDKWICFFNSQAEINKAMPTIKEIFDGYEVYVLLSTLKNLKSVMAGVKKAKKAVILSVNILLEGVHLSGVTGIVLYRNVTSTIAFQQMLGRTTSIGNDVEPVIIDTSQSARKILAKLLAENNQKGEKQSKTIGNGSKDIMRVGIGSTIEYDLENILRFCNPNYDRQKEIRKLMELVVAKYIQLKGKVNYTTFAELKNSGLDYKKFKASADLYGLSPETAFRVWQAG